MPSTKIDGSRQIKDASIADAQIAAAAAIATSKLADGANFTKRDGSVAFTGNQSMGGNRITAVGTPSAGTDAANKDYVDGVAQGLDIKPSVRAATTANITLSGTQTIDGVALSAGDRVLVKDQTTGSENGIYVVASGAWTRASDADTSAEVNAGMFTFVEEGTTNGDTGWVLSTNNTITLGTTALVFTRFSSAADITAGAGLTKTGTTVDVGAGDGIQVDTDSVTVKLDGTSLIKSGSGLKVNPAKFIVRETPSGSVNGSNTTFTLANTPVAGSEEVYLNGILQEPGAGNDYTISGATITYLTAPVTGDKLRVSYIIA